MEDAAVENPQQTSETTNAEEPSENMVTEHPNDEAKEKKIDISAEQVTSIMEVIAATGKFWHDWDMLKSLLSIRLKQVLDEYPESQVVSGDAPQQNSLSGETFSELVTRLDEALLSFIDGPPFTLQRLCEILLAPKSTYSVLSKLALALEKNLLVTSTLMMCTDPYPTALGQKQDQPEKGSQIPQDISVPVSNGVETVGGDGDEEMVEADTTEDATSTDVEMQEEKVIEKTDHESNQTSDSNPSMEACTSNKEENSSTSQTS